MKYDIKRDLQEMEKGATGCSLLERLTAVVGEDVFFVPCEWGMKRPLVTYVERPFPGDEVEAYGLFQVQERRIASGEICNSLLRKQQELEPVVGFDLTVTIQVLRK